MNLTEVQAALRDLLVAANVAAGRVVEGDSVAPPTLPYVEIGAVDVVDESGIDLAYCIATWTLHVWSDERGMKDVHGHLSDLASALEGARPAVVGLVIVDTSVAATQVFRDPDGVTRHGVATVRILLSSL